MGSMTVSGERRLRVGVLGPSTIEADGVPVKVDRALERGLAVRLALARGAAVPDDILLRDLWGAEAGDKPVERLRVVIYRLRQLLGEHAPAVHRTPGGYAMAAAPDDLIEVETVVRRLTAARQAGEPAGLAAMIEEALDHWRGPALADLRKLPFAALEATRLEGIQLDLRTELMEAKLAAGTANIAELEQLSTEHPLHERLVGLLAIALYRAERQAAALDRLATLRRDLADELGIDPSPQTAELELRLLRQDPALSLVTTTSSSSSPARSGLPLSSRTQFVGRQGEVATLLSLLTPPALITLTGGPGLGKTRLAREVAAARGAGLDKTGLDREVTAARGAGGRPVAWLDLASISTGEAVVAGLAAAVGVDAGAGDTAGGDLVARSIEKLDDVLLVIDNAEHLVDEVADLVGRIRRTATTVSILVTSQRPLRISGEEIHQVAPLSQAAAISLFCSRSGLGPHDRIDDICAAVDRIPLAVELAAGLTRTMTIDQLADRIHHRLRLLVGGNRDSGFRHSSLRAALDWSHSLADPPAQTVLRRLAVFAGGCTLEAAEQVVSGDGIAPADLPAILLDLTDRCLITVDQQRFRLLETVLDYAHEQLAGSGEADSVRRRHVQWCTRVIAGIGDQGEPEYGVLETALGPEEANLRAALNWVLGEGAEPATVAELPEAFWWYWWSRGLTDEARSWLAGCLDGIGTTETHTRAVAAQAAGMVGRLGGDYADARRWNDEALRIYRCLGDDAAVAAALLRLATLNLGMRDFDLALAQATEVLELASVSGSPREIGAAVNLSATALRCLGRPEEARRTRKPYDHLWRDQDSHRGEVGRVACLGVVAWLTGHRDEARKLYLDALRTFAATDLADGIAETLEALAGLELDGGLPERALRLLTVADRYRSTISVESVLPAELDGRRNYEGAARLALGDAADAVVLAARDLSLDQLVTELA